MPTSATANPPHHLCSYDYTPPLVHVGVALAIAGIALPVLLSLRPTERQRMEAWRSDPAVAKMGAAIAAKEKKSTVTGSYFWDFAIATAILNMAFGRRPR